MNFRDSNGATYVMMAANYGFSGIMKCLLDAGANPNIPDQVSYTISFIFQLPWAINARLDIS